VARGSDRVVGHLQLTDTDRPGTVEVKNTAVDDAFRSLCVGRALMEAAIHLARREGRTTVVVVAAAADTGSLRVYQRLGFRVRGVERDAFTSATGYAPGLELDGIPLRDRVWLDLRIDEAGG
jgi:ribosomal protein S18 acetylase RimI-like enzyme